MALSARSSITARRRPRGSGVEIEIIRVVTEADARRLIDGIALAINMRAALTPIAAGGDGDGEGK